jgi:hypothetical protein
MSTLPGRTPAAPDRCGPIRSCARTDAEPTTLVLPGSSCRRQEPVVQNQGMDVPKLLEAASLLVPEEIATENHITVNDVWEYLIRDEWEVALGLLEELGDVQPLPLRPYRGLSCPPVEFPRHTRGAYRSISRA